ncbi:hypothetical protein NDU88_000856 [Pleurodeles waltl]|uniref:Uncharacterized protein n=1 Tax=Pleurodeles waltl TaxID=8319 RepID=A0AAV7S9V9_PLEWA|nr:hypothetical protein NDU88_000856 [Pleurodeles waltl]
MGKPRTSAAVVVDRTPAGAGLCVTECPGVTATAGREVFSMATGEVTHRPELGPCWSEAVRLVVCGTERCCAECSWCLCSGRVALQLALPETCTMGKSDKTQAKLQFDRLKAGGPLVKMRDLARQEDQACQQVRNRT